MGINKENLLSDEHHASHFSCAICQDLSESPVTLACSHVFCEFCIGEYVARCLDRQQNALCPTCRAADCSSAQKLSEANPLAFRCYAKVQTCVEITFQAPRAIDATLSRELHLTG